MYRTTVNSTRYVDTATAQWSESTALIVMICAFVIALLIFFLVARMKNPTGKFTKKLKEFLNFRSIIIDGIIEFFYIFMTIIMTVASIYVMFSGVDYAILQGLAGLILGNIAIRVGFELIMLFVGLWQNTSDIRKFLEARHLKDLGEAPKKVAEKSEEKAKAGK
ncbi:DUF4282 domain-containing protein [Candidatus Saccharibacteria bacterium]|nr:DUF4282 domain-containing protein [Candidatus Saccharibacteria bacterium]